MIFEWCLHGIYVVLRIKFLHRFCTPLKKIRPAPRRVQPSCKRGGLAKQTESWGRPAALREAPLRGAKGLPKPFYDRVGPPWSTEIPHPIHLGPLKVNWETISIHIEFIRFPNASNPALAMVLRNARSV